MRKLKLSLVVNEIKLGTCPALFQDTTCYIDVLSFMKVLGYPVTHDSVHHCYQVEHLQKDRILRVIPDSIYNESDFAQCITIAKDSVPYVNYKDLERLSRFNFKFNTKQKVLEVTSPEEKVPALVFMEMEEKHKQFLLDQEKKRNETVDTIELNDFRVNAVGYAVEKVSGSLDNQFRGKTNFNGELLKGSLLVNYDYNLPDSDYRNQATFKWERDEWNNPLIKQMTVNRGVSNLFSSNALYTTGLFVSNSRSMREANSIYLLTGHTTPNTYVEVYNRSEMIAYFRSDENGYYKIEIPVYPQNNDISIISYDNFGNQNKEKVMLYIPVDLQAEKELAYSLASGITDKAEPYLSTRLNYGLKKNITLQTGSELLYRNKGIISIPIIGIKGTPIRQLYTDFVYMPDVKWSLTNIYSLHRTSFYLMYERYRMNQNKIPDYPIENIHLSVAYKLPFDKLSSIYYFEYQKERFKGSSDENTLSSSLLTTFNNMTITMNVATPDVVSKVRFGNLTYSVKFGWNITPKFYAEARAEYDSDIHNFIVNNRYRYRVSNLFSSFATFEYDKQGRGKTFFAGLTWYFPVAQIRVKGDIDQHRGYTNSMAIVGSVINQNNKKISLSNQYMISSHLLLVPFLDTNDNQQYDEGETIITDINAIISAGSNIVKDENGISYNNLPTNTRVRVSIPKQSVEKVNWQLNASEYCFKLYPYQTKTIYLPVEVVYGISGKVILSGKPIKNLSQIKIIIENKLTKKKRTVSPDKSGLYKCDKIEKGEYSIYISPKSIKQFNLKASDNLLLKQDVQITDQKENISLENIDFELTR